MIPGVLTGEYSLDEGAIDVAALAARGGIAFLEQAVVGIDPEARKVELSGGQRLSFDVLSLDIGSRVAPGIERSGPGVSAEGSRHIRVRPVESAASELTEAIAAIKSRAISPTVAVIGGGAAGIEIACGLRAALSELPEAEISLLEANERILADVAPGVGRRVAAILQDRGILLRRGVGHARATTSGIETANGTGVDAAVVVWASGAVPHEMLASSGLPRDRDGYLLVGPELRCRGTEAIYAAGDCATLGKSERLARCGVHAVRQGPVLAANLRRCLEGGGRMRRFRPQRDFLRLLSTGDGRAIAIRNGRMHHGVAWQYLKRQIDQRFIASFRPPALDSLQGPEAAMSGEMEECGGCAAKLRPELLDAALFGSRDEQREDPPDLELVRWEEREDAAIFRAAPDGRVVATLDAFPPFLDDLALAAEIGAVSAASDIFAMGARPGEALLLAGLPDTDDAADALAAIRRGTQAALGRLGVTLLGGHTLRAQDPLIGFTILGTLNGTPLRKQGARPGDRIILGKPLGTGIILAAARGGECPANAWKAAIESMRSDNSATLRLLRDANVRAMTDVTGFGLIGHLLEMLRPDDLAARLRLESIPLLAGARELAGAGWESSATAGLHAGIPPRECESVDRLHTRLLFDPQTSGGLLAAVPPASLDALLARAERDGEFLADIGEIEAGRGAGNDDDGVQARIRFA